MYGEVNARNLSNSPGCAIALDFAVWKHDLRPANSFIVFKEPEFNLLSSEYRKLHHFPNQLTMKAQKLSAHYISVSYSESQDPR